MSEKFLSVAIDQLMADPTQPRKTFDPDGLKRLADSIIARGVLQPLRIVRDDERECWLIVTGESRWRAAKLAKLTHLPCLVVEGQADEADLLADRITENSCRNDLLPLELARAMARLKLLMGSNSQTLAKELGISAAAVTRAEALLALPEDVQALVDDGRLAESAAYEISRLPDEAAMQELGHLAAACRMNRDQVIEAVHQKVGKKNVQTAGRVAGKLDGVSFSFGGGEALTVETLLKAVELIRSKIKEMQKAGHSDVTELAKLLRAS